MNNKEKNMLSYEQELYKKGIKLIAGTDEVGRGPLVGPVVAAAVILPENYFLEGIDDSKKLTEKKREKYFDIINKKSNREFKNKTRAYLKRCNEIR